MQKEKTIQFWNDFYSSSSKNSNRKESSPLSSSAAAAQDDEEEKDDEKKDKEVPVKEWILQPTIDLLDTIQSQYNTMMKKHYNYNNESRIQQSPPTDDDDSNKSNHHQQYSSFCMLEIGCGTSLFGLRLWEYLLKQSSSSSSRYTPSFMYHATDVSHVCIQQNRLRDASYILHTLQTIPKEDCHRNHHSFQYNHLDILHPHDSTTTKQYHWIIDKGCLDTFLFRTKSKLTSYSSHSNTSSIIQEDNKMDQKETTYNLMTHLLHNIHSMLIDDNDHTYCGKYIIFSPRSKIKPIRDFNGFSSVQKIKLDASSGVSFGDLDGIGRDHVNGHTHHAVYMYVCTKNCNYRIGTSDVFSSSMSDKMSGSTNSITDDESCKTCRISFHDFRNGEDMVYKGKKYWYRRWKGHLLHCKDVCKTS